MKQAGDVSKAAPRYRTVTRRQVAQDARLLTVFATLTATGYVLATHASGTAAGVTSDVHQVLGDAGTRVATGVLGLSLAVYLLALLAGAGWLLITRRLRLLVTCLTGAGAGLLAFAWVKGLEPLRALALAVEQGMRGGLRLPSAFDLVALAAVTTVAVTQVSRAWGRVAWSGLIVLCLARFASSSANVVDVLLAVGAGGLAGTLMLLAFGRSVRELTSDGVVQLLAEGGLDVGEVEPIADGRWNFTAMADGRPTKVRVVEEDDWRRERFKRGFRRLRVRRLWDEPPSSSPTREVAIEATVSLLARTAGAEVPQIRAVVRGDHGEAVLASDAPQGREFAALDADEVTDTVLGEAWRQLALIHRAQIGVRQRGLDAVVLTGDARVVFADLTRGEVAAKDELIAGDVAEFLAATSAVVGPERAVRAAAEVLDSDALGRALARLVPAALTRPTRTAIGDGLPALVETLSATLGVEKPEFERIERLRPRTLIIAAMLVAAIYVLAPQVAGLSGVVSVVRDVNPWWLVAVFATSLLTYVGAALGLAGATPGRVPLSEAFGAALASSFVSTFAPPGVGQVGLNIRYLQKRGLSTSVAATASAAKETAVVVMHLLLLAGTALVAGSSGVLASEVSELPSVTVVAGILGIVLVAIGGALAVPRIRKEARDRILPAVRESATAMRSVVSSPTKVISLFGGVALVPLGNALCLYFSAVAFGIQDRMVAMFLISLTAGTLAQAAPTPGGLGAVESVLLASMTGIGIAAAPALATVVLFRLATFWVPILPGAIAFRVLTARDML